MGGYSRQRKASSNSFSIFDIFKSCCCSQGSDDASEDGYYVKRRICPSEEDGRRWIAEPGIDGRASAFIARFYESRVSDPEYQTLAL